MSKTKSRNVWTNTPLTDLERGYVAGIVDGEGTLTIQRTARKESLAGCRHDPRMSVANSYLPVLEYVRNLCGGRILSNHHKPDKLHHKPVYIVAWTPNQIRWLLPQIAPLLRIKDRQARTLAEFLSLKENGKHATPDMWQRAEELRIEMKTLNWRGAGMAPAFETLTMRQSRLGNNQFVKRIQ